MAESEIKSIPDAHSIGVAKQPLDVTTEPRRAAATGGPVPLGAATSEPGASLTQDRLAAPSADPRAREAVAEPPPDDVDAALRRLAPWQARYALALYEMGGVEALAAKRCNVSTSSIRKAQKTNPDFVEACAIAAGRLRDVEEFAWFRGGTVGNLTPTYEKGRIVGYRRVRNTKEAEAFMRLRGRLREPGEVVGQTISKVAESQVPAIVAATLAKLVAARAAL
jgi:hypothetical protein